MACSSGNGFILLVAVLAGCTGSVHLESSPGGTSGDSPSGSDEGSSGGGSGSASGGTGGGTSGAGGTVGAPACGAALDAAVFDVDGAPPIPAEAWVPAGLTFEGVVTASSLGTVTIDTCMPGADCVARAQTLTASAPNLPAVLVPVDALVRVHFARMQTLGPDGDRGTSAHVWVENLSQWGGMTNPVSQVNRVWFAAATVTGGFGFVAAGDPDPYQLTVREQCAFDDKTLVAVQFYELTFPGSSTVAIPQGEALTLDVTGDFAGRYVFQSLRNTDNIEEAPDASYWLTGS